MMDFTTALDVNPDDVEAPKVLPTGTYVFTVTKPPEMRTFGKDDGWVAYEFQVKVVEATDDVDPDQLDDFGKVAGTPMRVSFMTANDESDKNSLLRWQNQIKKFLIRHLQVEGETLAEAAGNSVNAQFLGVVKHRADKNDPEVVYAEIKSTAPLMD